MKPNTNECRGLIYRTRNNNSGIALILVLGVLAVLVILATTFAFNMRLEQKAASNYLNAVITDCIARAGVEYAIALLRNDKEDTTRTYDVYTEPWHTSFTGIATGDCDNDGDGNPDSKWISVFDAQNNLIAAYAIYVVDELSKININRAGNLSDGGVAGDDPGDPPHGDNQGWTTSEIDLKALPNIGATQQRNIVEYRYGADNKPGDSSTDDDNDATPIEADGIDNDGYGGIDDAGEGTDEPDEYIPYNPFDYDVQFSTIEQIKLAGIGATTFWDATAKTGIKNLITVHSACQGQDKCYYSGGWQDRININAVKESYDLYNMIENCGGVYTAEEARRYAGDIIDYGDVDYVPTVCWNYGTSTPYYGIEGLQINEVMCNVSGIPRENNASYVTHSHEGGWTWGGASDTGPDDGGTSAAYLSWPWDNGTYDITITGANADVWLEGNPASLGANPNITIVDDKIDLKITDEGAAPDGNFPSFDKIVVHAGDFVEVINISELPITVDNNWKIEGSSSGNHNVPASSSVILSGHSPGTTIFDYLVVANSLYAIDYIYGNNDGDWDGDGTDGVTAKTILLNPMDIANAGEALGLYWNNGSSDVLIDIAPSSVSYGTVGFTDGGVIDLNESKERPSPINDTANWADSGRANSPGDYWCTPGRYNDGVSPSQYWHVHDGPFANIGLIGDVPKGTGADTTLDATDIMYFADRLTITAQRLEAEDANTIDGNPLPGTWTLQVGAGIDGTDLYEAPDNTGSWGWVWTDDGVSTTGNFRLFDGTYHLFVCADYPDGTFINKCNFQRPDLIDREVRPSCLAYAGTVVVSGKSFTVTIDSNGTDTPRLDYVLLVPMKDSLGRAGRININTALYNSTANEGVLEGLPGIDNALELAIINDLKTNGAFLEIGDILSVAGFNESIFAPISNLITVRSDVFKIYCTAQALDPIGEVVAEKKVEVIVDRSSLPIKILSWKEIME